MSASIKIGDSEVALIAGASISLNKPSGLLSFDGMEPAMTQQMRLAPTPSNRARFAHLERPASSAVFEPHNAVLEYRRLIIADGQLVVNKAGRQGLEGFFRSDAGALAEAKDRKIGELLAHLSVTLGVGTAPYTDAPFENGLNENVVFPPGVGRATPIYKSSRTPVRIDRSAPSATKAYDRNSRNSTAKATRAKTEEFSATRQGIEEMVLYNMVPFYTYSRALPKKYLPAFKITHLLRELAQALGYTLEVPADDYIMRQAVLFAWRSGVRGTGEQSRSYSYFLPEMTLSEFIASVRAMGTAIYIDSTRKVITAMPFDAVASRPAKDLSYCSDRNAEVAEAFGEDESTFSWGEPSQLVPNKDSVPTVFDLPAPVLGDVVLVERENRYYEAQAITVGDASFVDWRQSEPANADGKIARGGLDVQSLFVPLCASQVFSFTAENIKIREYAPTGKIRLEGFLYRGLKKTEVQYRIVEPEELSTGWYIDMNPTGVASDDPVLNIAYTKDYDSVVVEYRTQLGYFGQKLMPDIPEEVAPYIALHHGEQLSAGGDLYGYAGPTSYDPALTGVRLDEQDLKWQKIFERRMATAKRIIEQGKEVAHTLYPKVHDAVQFRPFAPVVIDGVHYLPNSFNADLGEVLKVEFRGWVV